MRVVILGGSGFIGARLAEVLKAKAHEVTVLSVRKDKNWESQVSKFDVVVNLAGEPIVGKRWNVDVKAEIHRSRIETTQKLVAALARAKAGGASPSLVNASAIGYYGATTDEELTESSPAGSDFLAFVCREWEEAALVAQRQHGIRTALIRIGIVLGRGGGTLSKLMLPFKLGLGGPVGLGRQWMSWVHLEDVVGILAMAVENPDVSGPINATAPTPERNRSLLHALARALHRPYLFPVPPFALFVLFGEVAEILVTGQRVLPKRALELGYKFQFTDINAAFQELVGKKAGAA